MVHVALQKAKKNNPATCNNVTITPNIKTVHAHMTPSSLLPDLAFGVTKQIREKSATAVAAHEGVSADGILHLHEGQWPHCDLTRALNFESRLLVKGYEEILTHEDCTSYVRQAAQVLQVAPHQDGATALLSEGTVHGKDMDVDCSPLWLVQSQGFLKRRRLRVLVQLVPIFCLS